MEPLSDFTKYFSLINKDFFAVNKRFSVMEEPVAATYEYASAVQDRGPTLLPAVSALHNLEQDVNGVGHTTSRQANYTSACLKR